MDFKKLEEKIITDLKEKVSEKRFYHSLLVANEAKKLAIRYGENPDEAYITGLAHDIAKDFSDEENKYFAKKYNLPKEILNPEYHNMLHSDIGAVVCIEWYGFSEKMSKAVKYHTTGHETMTIFEKIIYISDKIGRKEIPENIKELPRLAYINLDEALFYFLRKQKEMFKKKGKEISKITLKLMENIESELSKK